ncbi:serine protease [Vibrio tubiashii]|uniref:S1 family peptidase n=1 Tax=Vibrio tubiashii TaxID=29498 RepID=UPI001EFE754E|nr:serine protease [Vibrio tubiashii]MCG9580375.1 serine protease [Vibrio tubiashii]MCG9613966.1 serine protease [Vibrio tubiashii]MCG9689186.1 serine protease [Vibrio tubiashii]
MRKISVVLSCLWAAGAYSADVTPYIVNGTNISATTHPSFVSLFYDRIDYDGRYGSGPYCGGTLLQSQYVLTAAHCFYGSTQNQLFTSVVPQLQNETDFPNSVLQRVMVSEIYYPSNYNNSTLANDIAILKLASPITAVNSYADLAVPSDEATYRNTSEVFYAVGHGNTQTGVDSTTNLQRTQLKYVPNANCNVYTSDTSANLCMDGAATVNSLDNATCQGDSGGPLYWNSKQVGITSFGPQTCGNPSVSANSIFTEVSDHQTWINSVLSGAESPKVTATDAQRNSYLNPSSGGGGGGSLGLAFLTLLGFAGWRRSK